MPHPLRGKAGAEARWGVKRRLNLRDLTNDQRRVVLALVEAQRAANAAARPPEHE
jgi:hypothetical protein